MSRQQFVISVAGNSRTGREEIAVYLKLKSGRRAFYDSGPVSASELIDKHTAIVNLIENCRARFERERTGGI